MYSQLITRTIAVAAGLAAALGGVAVASAATVPSGNTGNGHHHGIRHVLLISVDGMHQSDLDWYVAGFRPDCGAGVRFMIKAGLVVMPPG